MQADRTGASGASSAKSALLPSVAGITSTNGRVNPSRHIGAGRRGDAVKAYSRAVELDPSNINAQPMLRKLT